MIGSKSELTKLTHPVFEVPFAAVFDDDSWKILSARGVLEALVNDFNCGGEGHPLGNAERRI